MSLDDLPLDVLLALQEAMTDPSGDGVDRARLRAADAGFHLRSANPLDEGDRVVLGAAPPLPMPAAPLGVVGVALEMGKGRGE